MSAFGAKADMALPPQEFARDPSGRCFKTGGSYAYSSSIEHCARSKRWRFPHASQRNSIAVCDGRLRSSSAVALKFERNFLPVPWHRKTRKPKPPSHCVRRQFAFSRREGLELDQTEFIDGWRSDPDGRFFRFGVKGTFCTTGSKLAHSRNAGCSLVMRPGRRIMAEQSSMKAKRQHCHERDLQS